MASRFINYELHGVAESSNLLATEAGHIESVRMPEDIDNGSFCSLDGFEAGDVWKIKEPTDGEPIYLIIGSPVIYEDYTSKMSEESNYFNGKNEVSRAYQLFVRDKFALSKECFADGAEPAVGKYLDFTKGYKAGVVDTAPTSGVLAHIYDIATNGRYRIVIEKI